MAQVEPYTVDQQTHHHQIPTTDQDHPALSSVPSAPGPELDPKHYHHEKHLPEPPLFSPPSTNTTFDEISFDHHQDLSIGTFQSDSAHADFMDRSIEDHSGSVNEPRTPESIAPSLDYVPFITSESDSLSVDHVGQPPEIIAKAQLPQANGVQHQADQSQNLNDQTAASTSQEHTSLKEGSQREPIESEKSMPPSIEASAEENKITAPAVNSKTNSQQVSIPLPKEEPRSKNVDSVKNTGASMSVDDWLDISRTEFQFAIGLFAIPWSSLVILLRSINMVWTLIFSQPLVQPIAGVILSITAPSLLYTSLVALLISSAAQISS